MSFKIENGDLVLSDGAKVAFKYPIAGFIVVDDIAVVFLNISFERRMNHNVFGVDKNGKILWEIPHCGRVEIDGENDPYVGVELRPNGKVVAYNWSGSSVVLNPKTGEILDIIIGK